MLNNIKAVIFDIDGTLIDSMRVWTDIDDLFVEKYHLSPPETFHEGMEGKSFSETAQYFLDLFPQLPFTKQELEDEWNDMAYDMYANHLVLKEGAYDFINALHDRGIKLGVATSNIRKLSEIVLQNNHVFHFFDVVLTADDVKAGKPSPDVYLKVAEKLCVCPEHCLVFEDVPKGIMGGKNAGMKVCAVDDDFSKHQEALKKQLADYYIYSYKEVL